MDMKLKYERPETINFVVEMEAGFCTGSGDDATKDSNSGSEVTIGGGNGHEGGDDIGFGEQTWS